MYISMYIYIFISWWNKKDIGDLWLAWDETLVFLFLFIHLYSFIDLLFFFWDIMRYGYI